MATQAKGKQTADADAAPKTTTETTTENIPDNRDPAATATADPAVEAKPSSDAEAEAVKAAVAAKVSEKKYNGVKVGETAKVMLVTPYTQVHPSTRTRFTQHNEVDHVFDPWIKAMVDAECMTVHPK